MNQSLKIEAQLQEKLSGKVLLNESLKKHTTMRVGGPARFFYKALDTKQICQAVQAALDLNLNYFLLGRGGNVIFSDRGFDGLVILNQANEVSFLEQRAQVLAESGIINSQLVYKAASQSLGGIEFLATIPGSLGGAIYGNAGAYGQEIGSFIKET